jgi:hypothetical protein
MSPIKFILVMLLCQLRILTDSWEGSFESVFNKLWVIDYMALYSTIHVVMRGRIFQMLGAQRPQRYPCDNFLPCETRCIASDHR